MVYFVLDVDFHDLKRVCIGTGATVQTSMEDLNEKILGTCGVFEEKQVGNLNDTISSCNAQ